MPALNINYKNSRPTREAPLVNAGHDWIIAGFTTVPECDSGIFEDCTRNIKDRETFLKVTNPSQSTAVKTVQTPTGYQYWYGDNSQGQAGKSNQLTKIADIYGNTATLHYRPDGLLGFIYFSTQEAVIFNYTTSNILDSITTAIGGSLIAPGKGQWVSRYELTHSKSETSDRMLLAQVLECGFDDLRKKSCAKPLVFNYSKGQLGYESSAATNIDPTWKIIPEKVIRTPKADKYTLRDMDLLRNGEKVVQLFNHEAFINAGIEDMPYAYIGSTYRLRPVSPTTTAIIGDFNGDGLEDIRYGGA
ncbi:MAG: hypothetical protein U5M23_01005 [Marinagarivorans sp.]|nr:hypothetical protein [Marinagarivorans sp.]